MRACECVCVYVCVYPPVRAHKALEGCIWQTHTHTPTHSPTHSYTFRRALPIGITLQPGTLLVQAVVEGAQAAQAGVRSGSVIHTVNGHRCNSVSDLAHYRQLSAETNQNKSQRW